MSCEEARRIIQAWLDAGKPERYEDFEYGHRQFADATIHLRGCDEPACKTLYEEV